MINANKKRTAFLLIFLGILILILALVFLFFSDKSPLVRDPDKSGETVMSEEEEFIAEREREREEFIYTFDENEEDNREWGENDFKQVARSFAERFGSYSNQSNFSNIEDLMMPELMSAKMMNWARDYVNSLKLANNNWSDFYGITTRSLIEPEVVKFDLEEGLVEVLVPTQREEISGVEGGKIFQQELKVVFVKETGKWLVDGAFWQ